jgi:hypothetical protein
MLKRRPAWGTGGARRATIDLKFDTDFLGSLLQAMLAGVALALMVAAWTDQVAGQVRHACDPQCT